MLVESAASCFTLTIVNSVNHSNEIYVAEQRNNEDQKYRACTVIKTVLFSPIRHILISLQLADHKRHCTYVQFFYSSVSFKTLKVVLSGRKFKKK